MKNSIRLFIILLPGLVLFSCSPSVRQRSEIDFQHVQAFVQNQEIKSAIQVLDSMVLWYKSDYGIIVKALKMKNDIGARYYSDMITSSEESIRSLEPAVAELSKNFRFIPGDAGRPGIFEHRRQNPETSWNRIYLRINLNEKGDTWLSSHYYGKEWIDHTSLRVYDNESYVLSDTIPLSDPWNRKVEDLGDKWETIEFREGTDAGIIAFIADNHQKSIKARFNGKKFQYIVLESYDKEAFHLGWELAQVLKEIDGLRLSIDVFRKELAKLGPVDEIID